MSAFSDLLVVSLEQAVAAPYTTRLLAEAGARIIKIERVEGDFARHYDTIVNGESAYFVWLNAGKESIVLDVKNDEDLDLLQRLISAADIFIQNLRPGAVARFGLDFAHVAALNPKLVMCSISGYGESGPASDKKAYDFLVQAESGLTSITGLPDAPVRCGISVCDIATGLTAYGEILRALFERTVTGRGTHVEVSLFDVMSEWMTVPLVYYKYGGKILRGTGLDHTQIAPYGAHQTADGLIIIAVQNHREWLDLCEKVLGQALLAQDPRFKDNAQRVQNRAALTAELEKHFKRFTRAQLAEQFDIAGIAYGNINNVQEVWDHPALKTKSVLSGGREAIVVRRVCDANEKAREIPRLDEHGEKIRAEFTR